MTKLYGVIGYPIDHSLSPRIHNAAYAKAGIDAVYASFAVEPKRLAKHLDALWSMGVSGLNVTVPLKEKVLRLADKVDESAVAVGACNTLARVDGKTIAYNTDGAGFLRALKDCGWKKLKNQHVLVLGAGGAARAVLWQLAQMAGMKITIANRTGSKARALQHWIKVQRPRTEVWVQKLDAKWPDDISLIVNTTSVGMNPKDEPPIDVEQLHSGLTVYDLIYNRETELIKQARRVGCRVSGGEGMLVYQGAEAFRIWLGKKAPVAIMFETLEAAIGKRRA